MTGYNIFQLLDLEQMRDLLLAHSKVTGICSAILDLDQNILVAEGWQHICTRFHRIHPATCARCLESDAAIMRGLTDQEGRVLEGKCKNGLWDIAMPIVIDGRQVATFFTGQFFYDDDEVDEAYFRAQAAEFGFEEKAYIAALRKVPVFTREQIRNIMDFYRNLVNVMVASGRKKLDLAREAEERRKAEEAHLASRNYLEKIINAISDPIFVKDRQHRLVLVNDAECALAGRSREEMLGKTDYDFFPGEQVDVFWEKDEIVFQTGRENINEEEITNAQGQKRVMLTKKTLYQDPNGDSYIVGIIRDITERKQAEEQLALLTFALNKVHEAVYLIDDYGRFLYVNDEACQVLEYSRNELLGMGVGDIDTDWWEKNWYDTWPILKVQGTLTVETGHKTRDGRIIPVEVTGSYFEYQGQSFSLALARDITERKRAEGINRGRLHLLQFAATHTLEELLQATLDKVEALTGSAIGFFHFLEPDQQTLSLQGWSTRTLAEFCTAVGKGMKYDVGQAGVWVDCVRQRRPVVHNDYASLPHRKGIPPGHPPVVRELVVPVMRNDRIVAILGVGNKLEDYTNQDIETVSIFADLAWEIAERKQAEVRLELVDFALNQVHEAAYLVDEHARFHYVNREACQSLGYSCDDLLGMTVADVDPDVSPSLWSSHWRELKAHGSLTFEGRHRHKDGHNFPVEINANYFEYDGQGYNLGLVRDITERKRMEDALRAKENEFRSLAENTPDTIARYDRKCRRLYANPAFTALAGVPVEELLGKTPAMYAPSPAAVAYEERIQGVLQSGQVDEVEFSWPDRDGRLITSHIRIVPEYDPDGRLGSVLCVGRDITERKRMEAKLKESEERYRHSSNLLASILESASHVSVYALDREYRYLSFNRRHRERAKRKWGADIAVGMSILDAVHTEEHRQFCRRGFDRVLAGRNYSVESREVVVRDGRSAFEYCDNYGSPIFNDEGEVVGLTVFAFDITERKQMEEKLRESEQRFREIFDNSLDCLYLLEVTEDGRFRNLEVNPAFERSVGMSRGELIGKSVDETIPAQTAEKAIAKYRRCLAAKTAIDEEVVLDLPSGRRTYHSTLVPVRDEANRVHRIVGITRDITEQKRTEELLRKREQEFRTLVENSPNIILRYDRDCRRSYVNPAFERETGIPSGTALLASPAEQWQANIPAEVYTKKLRRVMETGRPEEILLEWPRRNDGQLVSHAFHVVAEGGLNGEVVGALAIGHNITALKEAELRLAKLAATLPGFLFTFHRRPDGSICMPYASPRIREIFGVAPDTVAEDAAELFARLHPDDLGHVQATIAASAQQLTPWYDEFRVRHPEKGEIWIEGRSRPKPQPDGGILWYGFLHDITEHKQLEQELFKAKKMEIVGQLAGGVAHEVRNPLNAILSITEALFREKEIAENPEYLPFIEHIRTQVGRLSKLMTDLLDLGKPIKAEHFQSVSLNQILSDTISLWTAMDPTRNDRLNFTCDEQTRGVLVTVDVARLQQALLNLLDNALQHSIGNDPVCLHVAAPAGRCISIRIRDAGKGIPEAKLDKVFEPFFTTRIGGTGLGLPLVRHMVESMEGEVKLFNNEPPPGCTAELTLRIDRTSGETAPRDEIS